MFYFFDPARMIVSLLLVLSPGTGILAVTIPVPELEQVFDGMKNPKP